MDTCGGGGGGSEDEDEDDGNDESSTAGAMLNNSVERRVTSIETEGAERAKGHYYNDESRYLLALSVVSQLTRLNGKQEEREIRYSYYLFYLQT